MQMKIILCNPTLMYCYVGMFAADNGFLYDDVLNDVWVDVLLLEADNL